MAENPEHPAAETPEEVFSEEELAEFGPPEGPEKTGPPEEPVENAPESRGDFPPVRFPRLSLPLPGAEPQGLDENRGVLPVPFPDDPTVTVVLYNQDGSDRLWNFLFALKAQTRPPDEILIVDNCSADASVSFVRTNYPDVRIMELQERFPEERAWNLGFLAAGGDLVALVDSSLALPPEWLRRAVEAFKGRGERAGIMVCPIVGASGVESATLYNILGRPLGSEPPLPGGEPFAVEPGAVLIKRRLFPEGPFEESLPFGPDGFALGWRLRAFGSSVLWAFEARVLKPVGAHGKPVSPFRLDYDAEIRRWCTFRAFAETSTLVKLFPLWMPEALFRPLNRWFHSSGSFWGTLFGTAAGILRMTGVGDARGRMREERIAPDGAVTRGLSSELYAGNGVWAALWNAFSLAYLTAVGIPTREEGSKKDAEKKA